MELSELSTNTVLKLLGEQSCWNLWVMVIRQENDILYISTFSYELFCYEAHPESKFPDNFPFQISVISRVNCACVIDLWRINHMPAEQIPHGAFSLVEVVRNGRSYSFSRRLRGSVGNKVLECKKHWANWNLSSALSGLLAEHHE